MQLSTQRETLLKPLQLVMGVVERRQTLPILANVLLSAHSQQLSVTGTDLEVELLSRITLENPLKAEGDITVPGRKLLDLCRALPEGATIDLIVDHDRMIVRSGHSRFHLSTLPASDFPTIEKPDVETEFSISQEQLRHLTERTHFAMAQQDVRYYLNGLLLELKEGMIRAVATDGHRLALNAVDAPVISTVFAQVIVPRKGITELMRLLDEKEIELSAMMNSNHIRIEAPSFTFTSKLVDGRFPDYEKVLPKGGDKEIILDRDVLKQALGRASILSNEKFRGVRLQLRSNLLRILANNPEQEEAEEELVISYQGENLDIGFNAGYLLDILNAVQAKQVKITLGDSNASALIETYGDGDMDNSLYVVMPMRL